MRWRNLRDSVPDSSIQLGNQDKVASKTRVMASPKVLLRSLWEGYWKPAKCHGNISPKAFPDLSFLSLPQSVTGSFITCGKNTESSFFFFFLLWYLETFYLWMWRSMYVNSALKSLLSTLHTISYFLINFQKRNMMRSHHIIYLINK